MIGVTGEAYFAVCPKAVMGGGRLHVSLNHLSEPTDWLTELADSN